MTQNLSLIEVDPAEAVRLFERSMSLAPLQDKRLAQRATWNLAGLKRRAGDKAAADALTIEVHAWAERAGDHQMLADAELELGEMALQRGDAVEAFDRATRSRDLGASQHHPLLVFLAETLRCRAAVRLGRDDDALRSLADMMDAFSEGDLEAAAELDELALRAAVEAFAATGEVTVAGQLELVRRSLADAKPWLMPDPQRDHRDWLGTTGVVVSTESPTLDVPSALERILHLLSQRDRRRTRLTSGPRKGD